MSQGLPTIDIDALLLREYHAEDHDAVRQLYTGGLLAGHIPASDTGADIENIAEAYLESDRTGFWIVEYDGRVVGMIGVAEDETDIAEVRRLRVAADLQHASGIAARLMEAALTFCRHHGYLKVRLDTRLERGPAMELFERFAFQHHRSRNVQGKELHEFYLDLYREPKAEQPN